MTPLHPERQPFCHAGRHVSCTSRYDGGIPSGRRDDDGTLQAARDDCAAAQIRMKDVEDQDTRVDSLGEQRTVSNEFGNDSKKRTHGALQSLHHDVGELFVLRVELRWLAG